MKHKKNVLPVITLIIGLVLGFFIVSLLDFNFSQISSEEAGKKVKDLYEFATGATVEIISVVKESGIYKVIGKTTDYTGQSLLLEVYLTEDGKLLSERVLKLDEYVKGLENQRKFIDCLDEKGLKIYGISNTTATQLQLVQVLGGSRFLSQIYVDCVGANLQGCLDVGVETVPSVVYQGKVYEGVRTLDWFEEKTDCKFERD